MSISAFYIITSSYTRRNESTITVEAISCSINTVNIIKTNLAAAMKPALGTFFYA